tara:strand:- start:5389 stop:5772 length:384 start_codon:yes stop_codon:yes gene_type:complete
METEVCSICGDDINESYPHTLECNHKFHYKCLFLSFKSLNNLDCPYCRSKNNKLPLVNGLRTINSTIHDISNIDTFENHKCQMVLTRGKNKGKTCSKGCLLGYDYCKIHLQKYIKEQGVNNNVIENE